MSNDKKVRVMSPKGFLHKTTTKAALAAPAFIASHRSFLESGELGKLTTPILIKLDNRELMPTPALEAIKSVVLGYIMASEVAKGKAALIKREEQEAKPPKNIVATIYTKDGEVAIRLKETEGEEPKEEELTKEFDAPQDASRWIDRRLVDGDADWFGVLVHTNMTNKDGDPISSVISRQDAMARQFAKPLGPVTKSQAKSAGKLSWGVKSRPSTSKFSHG